MQPFFYGTRDKRDRGRKCAVASPPLNSKGIGGANGVRGMTQAHATITDLSGRTLLKQSIIAQESIIDISTLPSGVYLFRYQDADKAWNGKFVKD